MAGREDTTLAGLRVAQRGQSGASNIPGNAVQIFGSNGQGAAVPQTLFLDTASAEMSGGRIKSIYVVVFAAIPKTAAAQSLLLLYTGLQSYAGGSGAASTLPHTGSLADQAALAGAGVNLGTNAASLPVGLYAITPTEDPHLQWELPWVGVEINWVSAVNAGTGSMGIWIVQGAI